MSEAYDTLAISDGGKASVELERLLFIGDGLEPAVREQLRSDLHRYCHQDTWGLVKLLERLRQLTGGVAMDELRWQRIGNRHLNLFYTYRTRHLEDNVTRALVLTLRNLAPVHLRLFLRDVVLRKPAQAALRERVQLLVEDNFDFDLQVTPPDDNSNLLDAKSGVIVGVNYSGTQAPIFDATIDNPGGAKPDALISDMANELTAIFEIKLTDSLYREQIQRHFRAFFTQESTSMDQVFVEIAWTEIADFLQRVARQSVSERERLLAVEFVEYLDWLKLVEFLGFQAGDFTAQEDGMPNHGKLNKFLVQMASSLGSELGLKEYRNDWMLYFQDVPYENVYVEMAEHGVDCGIVCGSGKMWRAQKLRDYIVANPGEFRQMLERLRTWVDPSFPIVLRVHGLFHYSRFRTAWLGDLRGIKLYPDGYEDFVATLADRSVNVFERMPKAVIQERFAAEIKEKLQLGKIKVDGQGRFPQWEDIDSFLQYGYFHVDVRIPSTRLIGRASEDLLKTFKGVLEAEQEMMRTLSAW